MGMASYKDLEVFKRSYEQAKLMYEYARKFPREEQYGLASQMKRAATSISLNIAEGYGKVEGGKELMRFLSMAKGSCAELEVLLSFAKDFGYISEAEHARSASESEEIGKMLTGLIKSVKLTIN